MSKYTTGKTTMSDEIKKSADSTIEHEALLYMIGQMVAEYQKLSDDNNVRYPTERENDLRRKGHYGAMALSDLADRLTLFSAHSNVGKGE